MFKLCAFCSRLKFERGFCDGAESGFKFFRKIYNDGKNRLKFTSEICRGFQILSANLPKFERVIYEVFDGRAQNLTQKSSNFSLRQALDADRQILAKNSADKIRENRQINRKDGR